MVNCLSMVNCLLMVWTGISIVTVLATKGMA